MHLRKDYAYRAMQFFHLSVQTPRARIDNQRNYDAWDPVNPVVHEDEINNEHER